MPASATLVIPKAIQNLGGSERRQTELTQLFDTIRHGAPGRRSKASREDDAVIFAATLQWFWLKGRHRRPPSPPRAQQEAGVDSACPGQEQNGGGPAEEADPPNTDDGA